MSVAEATSDRPRASRQGIRNGLRDMILDGRCPPGSRLLQHDLAKQFGASLGVIREVLLELRAAGLVEMQDNVGFSVCELNAERLAEVYELRGLHEGHAARLCCERASLRDVRELKELADQSYAARCAGDPRQVKAGLLLDRRLHQRLIEIAANQTLIRVTQSYWAPLLVCEESPSQRWEETHREHLEIIQAIETNRPDDAERIMRQHVRNGLRHVQSYIAEGKLSVAWWV